VLREYRGWPSVVAAAYLSGVRSCGVIVLCGDVVCGLGCGLLTFFWMVDWE
jgi:hypothetical protein